MGVCYIKRLIIQRQTHGHRDGLMIGSQPLERVSREALTRDRSKVNNGLNGGHVWSPRIFIACGCDMSLCGQDL